MIRLSDFSRNNFLLSRNGGRISLFFFLLIALPLVTAGDNTIYTVTCGYNPCNLTYSQAEARLAYENRRFTFWAVGDDLRWGNWYTPERLCWKAHFWPNGTMECWTYDSAVDNTTRSSYTDRDRYILAQSIKAVGGLDDVDCTARWCPQ